MNPVTVDLTTVCWYCCSICENVLRRTVSQSHSLTVFCVLISDPYSDRVWSPGHKSGCAVPQEPHAASTSLCAKIRRSPPRLLHGQT